MIWIGLAIMVVSETATLLRIEPFWSWNTPIAWSGFILFADGVVFRARGESWIRSSPREFAALALVSIPLWLVFEGYNRIIDNWNYTGLPENLLLRQFGYAEDELPTAVRRGTFTSSWFHKRLKLNNSSP